MHFNPRTPQGGATLADCAVCRLCNNFNPRTPQGGATGHSKLTTRQIEISIHAPRKGVRLENKKHAGGVIVFQSTHPARGCDQLYFFFQLLETNFNPRTPQGGATQLVFLFPRCIFISIHAPRKGVRQQNCVKIDTIAQFRELSGNDTSRNLRFCSL